MITALPRLTKRLLTSALLALTLLLPLLLPSLSLAAGNSQLGEWINKGRQTFLGDDSANILPPEQAFKLQIELIDAQHLQAAFKIAPGHYLYKDRIKFEIEPASLQLAPLSLPAGDWKQDPTFGRSEVFHHSFTSELTLAQAATGAYKLKASYQGCSEKGLCYPPAHQVFELDAKHATPLVKPGSNNLTANNNPAANSATNPGLRDQPAAHDQASALLASGNTWLIIAGFFGFGLLLCLTPCVLPMIPILSGIIVGTASQDQGVSKPTNSSKRWRGFKLSLAYTLGMALSYTAAGVAAGLSGQLLSAALQNAWVLAASALIFILLALSMFGFYELKLPSSLENRLLASSQRLPGGQSLGVFAMGVLSALIVSPCVAAPLAGALLYISQSGDVVLGASALFALSMGMGLPLLLLGATSGAWLPKSGPWMLAVRQFFGVLMLAVALWLVSSLLPSALQLLLWAALLIVPAIFMRALDRLPEQASAWQRFWKGIAIIMLLLGATLVVGAASGAKSPLHPLEGLAGQPTPRLTFQPIKGVTGLQQALAANPGKLVMLDFYADWCVSCKEMEQFTFRNAEVQASLQDVIVLQTDVTANDEQDQALLKQFALFGPPAILFFGKQGELTTQRVIGYQDSQTFLASITQAKGQFAYAHTAE